MLSSFFKKILSVMLALSMFSMSALALELDTSVDEEIRKHYNPSQIEKDLLPPLPKTAPSQTTPKTAPARNMKTVETTTPPPKSLPAIDTSKKTPRRIQALPGQTQAKNKFARDGIAAIKLKKGIKVILHVEDSGDGIEYSVEDVHRSGVLLWLSLIFCGLLIYVGRKKGFYSLISIAVTCILIYNFLCPLVLLGVNPVLGTILISILSTALTMYLVGGFNKKSTSAVLGCVLSLVFAGILSFVTVKAAYLNGFSSENTMFLFSAHPELDFISIVISTMMLATLGAVMDVAMSIASTINEIFLIDSTKSVKELFISGMNVGRDIIGTMANTLILVYLGGSLPLLLLASNIDLQKFINLNQVVTEIASALIGSCAIVICVPITAIVAENLVRKITVKPEAVLESNFSNIDEN